MIRDLISSTDLETMLLVGGLVGLLLGSVLGYRIGRQKDRPLLGVILGGLLTLPGLITMWMVPPKEPEFY